MAEYSELGIGLKICMYRPCQPSPCGVPWAHYVEIPYVINAYAHCANVDIQTSSKVGCRHSRPIAVHMYILGRRCNVIVNMLAEDAM